MLRKELLQKIAGVSLGLLMTVAPSAAYADNSTAQTFTDVDASYWAYQDIENLAAQGIVAGFGGAFHPENNITRAEFAKMITAAQGLNFIVYQNTNGLRVFQTQQEAVQYASLWDHSFVVQTSTGQVVWNNFDSGSSNQLHADAQHQFFSDVPSSFWGYSYIEAARIAKVIAGNSDGTFAPNEFITREDIATLAMRSLGIADLKNYNGVPLSFSDKDQLDAYAVTATTVANNLGIIKGETTSTFAPLAQAKRAEAAAIVSRLMNLTRDQVLPLQEQAVVKGVVSPQTTSLEAGKSTTYTANFYNADNALLPVHPIWSTTGGVGTVNAAGVFTANKAGSGTVVATAPGSTGVAAVVNVTVTEQIMSPSATPTTDTSDSSDTSDTTNTSTTSPTAGPPAKLVFTHANYSSTAGQAATIQVDVEDSQSAVVTSDNGRKITLTVQDPENRISTYTANDVNGIAVFNLPETYAGSYDLSAVDAAKLTTVSDAALHVTGATPVGIALDVAPSPFLVKGQTAHVRVYLTDQYGNQTNGPDTAVALTVSNANDGTLTTTSSTVSNGSSVVGTYQAGSTPGDAIITAQAVNSTWQPATITVTTMQSAAQVVSGKGMWLMHGYDWHQHSDDSFIQQAKADGITHLYIELGATNGGFWGQDVIDGLVTKAHQAHIAVIDWVYCDLSNPTADANMTVASATYTASGGDRTDGIAADLEENVTQNNVIQYAQMVRTGVGSSYVDPLIAVTYPPSSRPNYPWTTFGKYFDVIEPMDYWHYLDQAYTPTQAYSYVQQSIQQILNLTGNPNLPITIAGQSYNMFNDNQSPTGDEEKAAMQAAKDNGAIGYSMYRWGTATGEEWSAFSQFAW